MEFGLLSLPFGWSDTELVRAHRFAWAFGIFFNLLAALWCMLIARKLQVEASMGWVETSDPRYIKAKIWFGVGMLLIPAILLYPVLGLYMLVPVVVALMARPFLEIFAGLCLAGILIASEIYCTVRTIKNPNWH